MSYDFSNTIGGKLCKAFQLELLHGIVVPNSMLPIAYHNHKEGGRSLAELNAMLPLIESVPDDKELEAIAKAERVEQYRQQWEDSKTINYY